MIIRPINKADALSSLTPGAEWVVRGGDVVEWLDTEQTEPTETEINTEVARLQAEFDAQQFSRDRVYPDMGYQLDMLFHELKDTGSISATGTWATMIQGVKDGSPKPTN